MLSEHVLVYTISLLKHSIRLHRKLFLKRNNSEITRSNTLLTNFFFQNVVLSYIVFSGRFFIIFLSRQRFASDLVI